MSFALLKIIEYFNGCFWEKDNYKNIRKIFVLTNKHLIIFKQN